MLPILNLALVRYQMKFSRNGGAFLNMGMNLTQSCFVMKIAFFVWEYPPLIVGGLGTYASYITREFVELGHDVSVFTLNNGNLKTREVIKGIEVHRPLIVNASNILPLFVTEDLKRWGTNIKFFSDVMVYNIISAAKFLNLYVKKELSDFDIVCVHDWLSAFSGLIIENDSHVPVAFHIHSTEWGRRGGGGSQTITQIEDTMAREADGVITVSCLMRDDLINHGYDGSKIHVVWNGVDERLYNPNNVDQQSIHKLRNSYGIKHDEKMIFCIGRLTPVKGIRNLILALPSVVDQFPNVRLIILGEGEEEADLMELVERLKLNGKVTCRFEFIPESERILHYAASDLCVFPSIYEPFGIVSLEAMAMKKPVVVGARGISGFREQVVPSGQEQNGIHVNGQDPADIAWGIKEVLKDAERAEKWGENGRVRVLKYFTWEIAAKQTLKMYEKMVVSK
jgi:glycogen(starch) synthase